MKITAHIRMLDSGRFEAKCKTLPGCPVIEARTFPQALQDLQEAIHDEFIEQFYAGTDPGQIEIEATALTAALTAALTFTLDREINHSIFDFGTPRAEEKGLEPIEPRALPESTRTEGWAPALEGPTYHYYLGDIPLCGCAEARGGPHECEAPAGIPPFGSPACRECLAALEFAKVHGDPEEVDEIETEGWAPTVVRPEVWHYFRDGEPVCGFDDLPRTHPQAMPPLHGACPACIEVLHKEELPPIPGHEEDHSETPEEEPAPPRRMILGWGRIYRHDGYGPYHALDLDGMAVCGRMKTPIDVSTDHPEEGERVCKICWGLVAGKADVVDSEEEEVLEE